MPLSLGLLPVAVNNHPALLEPGLSSDEPWLAGDRLADPPSFPARDSTSMSRCRERRDRGVDAAPGPVRSSLRVPDALLELVPSTPAGWLLAGLLGLVLLALLVPFTLLPLLVHAQLRLGTPRLAPRGPADPPLPTEALTRVQPLVAGLERLGYRRVADLVAPDLLAGSRFDLTLLRLPDSPWGAVIMVVRSETGGPGRIEVHLQLGTRFAGGTALVTGNTPTGARLPNRPSVTLIDLPGLEDPALLERVHRARLLREGRGREVLEVPEAEQASAMERDLQEDLAHGERIGLLRRQDDLWRPTWRGAFRLGWAACWPVSALRRWRGARRAGALLAELGVESPR